MKKLFVSFFSLFLSVIVFAQTPEKMSYQAVIRNGSNNLITSSSVGMQISILQGSASGTAVYVETQTPTTNANGLVSIEIGTGTVRTGDFSTIDWANGPYFIKTETDPTGGSSYSITGTSQLLSVPYAMHSKTADMLTGGGTETDPVFAASEAAHITKTDINKLYWLYGTNTGDQDLSYLASKSALGDSAALLRSEIPDVSSFLSSESDPLFFSSIAAGVTGADTAFWNDKSEFSGNYNDLSNIPTGVSAFSNDVGYQLAEDDGDVTPNNEIQEIYGFDNTIALTKANQIFLPDFEGDPKFSAWDKSSGISITESQIIDLNHFTGDDITGSEAAFFGWDKNAADDFTVTDETDQVYSADSSFIKTGVRSWNSSPSSNITTTDIANWNDKSYVSDLDGDTKIETEQGSDEDVIRMNVAGAEALQMNNTSGTVLRLPTNNSSSSLRVNKANGTQVFGVDGTGKMTGDGSGLSNVKPLMNYIGGNQWFQITANYGYYDNVRTVTFDAPSAGKCFVMASGYVRWESKGWDLFLGGILKDKDPNSSWNAENEWYRYLSIITDYNCQDSSDQYTNYAQHRSFNVAQGTHTFTLWANKYSTNAKTSMGDVNLTVMFFPTGGTNTPMLGSTQLENKQDGQELATHFTGVQRTPSGGLLHQNNQESGLVAIKNEDATMNQENEELKEIVRELQSENDKLKVEKKQIYQRLNSIEKQIEILNNKR